MTISPNAVRWTVTLIVSFIFLWAVWAGSVAGRDLARARASVERATVFQQGLALFYEDQARFPSEAEYTGGERLRIYLQNFPGPEFTHKKWCQALPRYASRGGSSFQYDFCLPRGYKAWTRGWHSIDERSQ